MLGKKILKNEILKEAVKYAATKSGLRARSYCPSWRGICAITAYNHIARPSLTKVESDLHQLGQIIVSRSAIPKVFSILARTDSYYALELQTEVGGGTKAHFSHDLLYCKSATFQ